MPGPRRWARQRGFSKATVRRMVKDQLEAGYSTGWVYASKENKASRRSIEKEPDLRWLRLLRPCRWAAAISALGRSIRARNCL